MSKPVRSGLLVLAIVVGWTFFGERLKPLFHGWADPIAPTEYSDHRGDPDSITQAPPGAERGEGPRREHIRDRVRRKVQADLKRGVQRNDR